MIQVGNIFEQIITQFSIIRKLHNYWTYLDKCADVTGKNVLMRVRNSRCRLKDVIFLAALCNGVSLNGKSKIRYMTIVLMEQPSFNSIV